MLIEMATKCHSSRIVNYISFVAAPV